VMARQALINHAWAVSCIVFSLPQGVLAGFWPPELGFSTSGARRSGQIRLRPCGRGVCLSLFSTGWRYWTGLAASRSVWSAPHPGALGYDSAGNERKRRNAAHSKRFATTCAPLRSRSKTIIGGLDGDARVESYWGILPAVNVLAGANPDGPVGLRDAIPRNVEVGEAPCSAEESAQPLVNATRFIGKFRSRVAELGH
jgi:hypothetical protein